MGRGGSLLPAGHAHLLQWLLVAVVALAASIHGGLAGYGTGRVLPLVQCAGLIATDAIICTVMGPFMVADFGDFDRLDSPLPPRRKAPP